MNLNKLFKKLSFLIMLLTITSSFAFAQVYVDATNGNDGTGDGSSGSPYASIAKGLSQLPAAGGTLVLKAGTYTGAGLATTNDDIVIADNQAIDGNTQPNWDDNAVITIRLEQLNGNNEIKVTDTDASNFTFNIKGGTLNIVSASGTEYLNLADVDNFVLGDNTNDVTVNIATLTAGGGAVTVQNGAVIKLYGTSSFSNEAPKKGANISLEYLADGNQTAGPEAKYGSFGTGTITVNKTNDTDEVTFPNTAITAIGGITVTKGTVTFQNDVTVDGDVTLAAGGNATFTNLNMKNFDLVHGGTGTLTISGNLDFLVTYNIAPADINVGQLEVTGGGTVTVSGTTQWSETITGDVDLTTNYGINLTDGKITLSGVTLTNDNGDGTNDNADYTFTFYNNDTDGNLTIGTITVNSTASANQGYGIVNVTNQNTGSLSFDGTVKGNVVNNTTGFVTAGAATISGNLTNSGTFTFNSTSTITGNVTNSKTLVFTGASSITGNLVNNDKITFNAGSVVDGAVDNNANATITLNADLELKAAGTHTFATTSKFDGTGTIKITGASEVTIDGAAGAATISNLIVDAAVEIAGDDANATANATDRTLTITGDLTINDNLTLGKVHGTNTDDGVVTVNGTTTLTAGTFTIDATTAGTSASNTFTTKNFTQTGGTITLDNANNAADEGVLKVSGNFSRTNGTFTATEAGALVELNGTAAQDFDGGPNFQLADLTVSNTSATVTLKNTVRASGTVTINTGATVELGNLNIVFNAATGKMVNNGTIKTTGATNGAIIFGGANFVAGGNNVDGMVLNASSTAVFSNIIIDVGSANDVVTTGTSGDIRWTGQLYLYSGDLTVNDGAAGAKDLAPSGSSASIKRNLSATGSVNGITLGGDDTFNTAAVDYNLEYTGTLAADKTINTTTAVEWDSDNVVDLTISANGASSAVILAGNVNRTLKGNLTLVGNSTAANAARLTGDNGDLTVTGNLNVGENSVLTLANNAGTDLTVSGVLTVSKNASIVTGNAGSVISLAGNSKTHSILGKITASSILTVDGTDVVINGQAATTDVDASELANLTVASGKSATVAQIHAITGNVETKATSTLVLGLTQNSTSPADADNGYIGGTLTLGGDSFTLASNVEVKNTVTHNKGTFDFSTFDLTRTTAGNYTRAADASAVYTGSGKLVLNFATLNFDLNDGTIPNVEVKANTVFTTAAASGNTATFSGTFTHTAGAITLTDGFTVSGNAVETAGSYSGTGTVKLVGATTSVTAAQNVTYTGPVTVNSTGTVLFRSDAEATPKPRTFTVNGVFTQTAGNVDLGINKLVLTETGTDAFVRTTGNWLMTTGELEFNQDADAAVNFNPGDGWSIKNLTINNTQATNTLTTNENKAFTVTGTLNLVDGVLQTQNTSNASTNGLLHLADGAVIKRDAAKASLNEVPTFDGTVDVYYIKAGGTTGNELPTSATALNDLHVEVATTLNAAATVNGTLYLKAGAFTTASPKLITMANGATIERVAGTISAAPVVTSYNLVYKNTADTTTGNELVASKVANLTLNGTADVVLGTSVTMSGNLVVDITGGNLDLGGNNLTTAGDVTITKGSIENTGGTLAQFKFNGTAAQTFTVPSTGLTFPATSSTSGVELVLDNTSTDGVTLAGGNLTMQNTNPAGPNNNVNIVRFVNGVLRTGNNVLTLWQSASGSNQPLQGFDRTGVDIANGKYSHVVGNVKKFVDKGATVAITEVEFPVGTEPNSPGNYRPAKFYFKTAPQSSINLTVTHDAVSPKGTNGIPLNTGSLTVTNYPDFFWYVKSDQALAPSYKYDVEFQAQGYTDYQKDGIQNIRLIRRDSGNVANQWVMQGADNAYDNSTINSSWPVVKVIDATGGITTQGSKFTYSQNNKPPVFDAALTNTTIAEGDSVVFTYVASDPDINQTATMSAVTLPEGATFDASTGKFRWVTDNYDAGNHTVTIRATDGTESRDTSVTITVTNVNALPQFVNVPEDTTSVPEGSVYTFTFTASDPDTNNTGFTYSLLAPADSVKIVDSTGVLTFNPAFGEENKVVNYTVRVTDGDGGVADTALTFKVVNQNRAPQFATAMADTNVDEAATLTLDFKANASDPDGDPLTFSFTLTKDGSTVADSGAIDASTGIYTWTPKYTQAGVYELVVTATDGVDSAMDTVAVTVNNKNAAPTWVKVLPDTTIFVGDTLNFTYMVDDLDMDAITFMFNGPADARANLDASTGKLTWDPQTENDFISLVKVKATDGIDTIYTEAEVTVKRTTVTVSGTVSYDGMGAIDSAVVVLKQGETVVATDTTDLDGKYIFADIDAGDYTVMVSKDINWPESEVLASDALLAARSAVDTSVHLTDMQELAADVDGNSVVTASDALQILQRVVKLTDKFTVADWLFESKDVKVGTKNVTVDIKGIAAGDVNKSAQPNSYKKETTVSYVQDEMIQISPNAEFEIPVKLDAMEDVSAFTMNFSYPADKMELVGVKSAKQVISNAKDGQLAIAWADLNGKESFEAAGDAIVVLKFKATEAFKRSESANVELESAEVVNKLGKDVNSSVSTNGVEISIPNKFALNNNYPNPFNPTTTISYDLPVQGKVTLTIFNSLGQEVAKLVNGVQEAGSYKQVWNATNVASGVYFFNITVEGTKNFTQTKKMVLLK